MQTGDIKPVPYTRMRNGVARPFCSTNTVLCRCIWLCDTGCCATFLYPDLKRLLTWCVLIELLICALEAGKLLRKFIMRELLNKWQMLCNNEPHWPAVFSQPLVLKVTLLRGPPRNRNFWNKPWRLIPWAHLSAGRRLQLLSQDGARKTVWRDTR